MQHQILINVIIFVAYVLNLPLNTQRSHSRSQRPGKWSLILAHDRRPIYRAPTYIAVPLLGPHQPRYIGLTLYRNTSHCIDWSLGFPFLLRLLRCLFLPLRLFLAATKQLYEWFIPSDRPSVCVCLPVCLSVSVCLSHTFDYVPIIVD